MWPWLRNSCTWVKPCRQRDFWHRNLKWVLKHKHNILLLILWHEVLPHHYCKRHISVLFPVYEGNVSLSHELSQVSLHYILQLEDKNLSTTGRWVWPRKDYLGAEAGMEATSLSICAILQGTWCNAICLHRGKFSVDDKIVFYPDCTDSQHHTSSYMKCHFTNMASCAVLRDLGSYTLGLYH